jgi:hypothetical protein
VCRRGSSRQVCGGAEDRPIIVVVIAENWCG